MKNYDLVLLNDIIKIFEENKFAEANILHKQFVKLAQPIQNENEKEALDIIAEKNLQDQFKQFAIKYYKSQSQFDESDDFDSIFTTYGSIIWYTSHKTVKRIPTCNQLTTSIRYSTAYVQRSSITQL